MPGPREVLLQGRAPGSTALASRTLGRGHRNPGTQRHVSPWEALASNAESRGLRVAPSCAAFSFSEHLGVLFRSPPPSGFRDPPLPSSM